MVKKIANAENAIAIPYAITDSMPKLVFFFSVLPIYVSIVYLYCSLFGHVDKTAVRFHNGKEFG